MISNRLFRFHVNTIKDNYKVAFKISKQLILTTKNKETLKKSKIVFNK